MDQAERNNNEELVDVMSIMAEIQRQIELRRDAQPTPKIPLVRGPLPSEFYEALNLAEQSNDDLQPKILLTESTTPLIGGLVQLFRKKFHQLVIFYVNQLAANQIRFNAHILRSITLLGEEVAGLMEQRSDNIEQDPKTSPG